MRFFDYLFSCNKVTFYILFHNLSQSCFIVVHSWTCPFITRGWVFLVLPKGRRVQIFSIQREGYVNKGGCSKKGYHSFASLLTLSNVTFLGFFLCVHKCLLLIYTIPISPLCVSHEVLSFIQSNLEIRDFCNWVIFEKQRYCGPDVRLKFLISLGYSFNVI